MVNILIKKGAGEESPAEQFEKKWKAEERRAHRYAIASLVAFVATLGLVLMLFLWHREASFRPCAQERIECIPGGACRCRETP